MWGFKQVKTDFSILDGLSYYLANRQDNETVINSKFFSDFTEMLEADCYNHIKRLKDCSLDDLKYTQGEAHYAERILDMLKEYKRMSENR